MTPSPILLDDSELLRAASTPRVRLFPALYRASAFAPLIIVCCVFPAFQLLTNPTLDEEDAIWGIRAIAVSNATTLREILEPGVNDPSQPMIFQPPLAAWLNGATIRVLGPLHPLSTSLISLLATAVSIWLTSRLAWRIGGAQTALVSALLMCCHPQTLKLAISPSHGSITLCLMIASVFGFQRHLEGKWVGVSPSLLISGIVWGLCLLSGGPIAFTIPLLFALHALNQRSENQTEYASPAEQDQFLPSRIILKSMCFLVGTGLLLSTWWGLVVGVQGFRSWLTSLPIESLFQESYTWNRDLNQLLQPTWREWLLEQSLLLAWLVVGLERSWHVIRSSESEIVRRRYQLLLFWWVVAFIGRNLADILSRTMIVNTSIWNLALLGPTVLLASLGIGTLIERKVSRRGEFFLVILIVCLTIARITMSWLMGLIGGAIAVLFLISGPLFIHSAGRTERSWSQEGWRQLLQITVYGSLLASLFLGLGFRSTNMKAMNDAVHLASLRERLKSFPEVQRISLITAQAPIPMTLNYLLRSRWPTTEIAIREGWDTGLTDAMANESTSPHSRFLILEWTFHDTRFSANTGLAWRIKSIGDPVRFHDRRLSMSLIEPQQ